MSLLSYIVRAKQFADKVCTFTLVERIWHYIKNTQVSLHFSSL